MVFLGFSVFNYKELKALPIRLVYNNSPYLVFLINFIYIDKRESRVYDVQVNYIKII